MKWKYLTKVRIAEIYCREENGKTEYEARAECPFCNRVMSRSLKPAQLIRLKEGVAPMVACDGDASLAEMFVGAVCDDCWPDEEDE